MKLAYVSSQKQGETDRLLTELADDLQAGGLELRGIVKEQNYSAIYDNGCDMYVRVLPDGPAIKITQDLGGGRMPADSIPHRSSKRSRGSKTAASTTSICSF